MSDNRPIAYVEDDITYYRASGSGSCLLAIVAAKAGYKPDRNSKTEGILMSAAKEGNLHEGAIVDELIETYGWKVWGDQELLELKVLPRVFIRGHIDGYCKPKRARNDRLVEIKTMSKDRFKKWMASGDTVKERLLTTDFLKYGWQISIYMHAANLPAMYVVKNRDSGELDIGELPTPPISMKEIRKKIIEAEMWSKKGELPPCEAGSGEKWFCPYPYLHDIEDSGGAFQDEPQLELTPVSSITDVLVASIAERFFDLKKQTALLSALDNERKDVGKKLVDAMGGRDSAKKIVAGKYEISRSDRESSSVNEAEFIKQLGVSKEVFDAAKENATKKSPFSVLTVKKIGDK